MSQETSTRRARVRLSLDVSPALNDRLEEIAATSHSTKSEVLRKAVALFDIAVEARENGQKLWVGDQPPAGVAREIVGI